MSLEELENQISDIAKEQGIPKIPSYKLFVTKLSGKETEQITKILSMAIVSAAEYDYDKSIVLKVLLFEYIGKLIERKEAIAVTKFADTMEEDKGVVICRDCDSKHIVECLYVKKRYCEDCGHLWRIDK